MAEALDDAITPTGLLGHDATGVGKVDPATARTLLSIALGATANATDAELRDRATHTGAQAQSTVTGLVAALAALAPLASPVLTGTPTAPTAAPGTNTAQLATMAALQAAVATVAAGLEYLGTWNATTNTPTLSSGSGTGNPGGFYVVATAGSTSINGIASWAVGDWIISDDVGWKKIVQTDAVSSVLGRTGVVTAQAGDYTADQISETGSNKILTSAERTKLAGIEASATADQTAAEIETAYNAQVSVIAQAEAEAGTATTVRRWTAQRVAQAIAALAPGGGAGASGSNLNSNVNVGTPATSLSTTEAQIGSVAITPSVSTAKVLVIASVYLTKDTGTTVRIGTVRLRRGTANGDPQVGGDMRSRSQGTASTIYGPFTVAYIDSPGVTSAVTYTVRGLVDAGNSTATAFHISAVELTGLSISSLTEDTNPDGDADYWAMYDASAGVNKKVLPSNLLPYVNVKWYGALGDGSTDDTTAFQAAIDAVEATSGSYPPSGTPRLLIVPPGNYIISTALNVGSGSVQIKGSGWASKITTHGTFTGTTLFNLVGTGGYCSNCIFEGMQIIAGTDIACFRDPSGTNLINTTFRDLLMKCSMGIIIDAYAQEVGFENLIFTGANKTLIQLKGNANHMSRIFRESGDGTAINNGTEPLISLLAHAGGDSYDLTMSNIVLEGYTASNKVPIKATAFDNVFIESYHSEATTNGYCLDLDDCLNWNVAGRIRIGTAATSKIKLRNGSELRVGYLNTNDEDKLFTDWLDLDSSSSIFIDRLYARRFNPVSATGTNVYVGQQRAPTNLTLVNNWTEEQRAGLVGRNFLANPSFEAGGYGWTVDASFTATYPNSEVSPGSLMAKLVASATGNKVVSQQFSLTGYPTDMPWSLSAWVKVVGNGGITGTNVAGLMVNSISAADPLFSTSEGMVKMNTGWQRVAAAFVLGDVSSSFQFGILTNCADGASGNVEIYIDEICLTAGCVPYSSIVDQQMVNIGSRSVAFASAAPTTGTWKRGDVVFNNTPSAAGVPAWTCTTAGTPGTWKAWGVLAA